MNDYPWIHQSNGLVRTFIGARNHAIHSRVWNLSALDSPEARLIQYLCLTDAFGNKLFVPINRKGLIITRRIIRDCRSVDELKRNPQSELYKLVFAPNATISAEDALHKMNLCPAVTGHSYLPDDIRDLLHQFVVSLYFKPTPNIAIATG